MSVVDDVLKTAASRIGYYAPNDPNPGSEAGRYWAQKTGQKWLQGPSTSIWWCMLFVSMVLDMNGQIDAIGGFSYNTDITLGRNRNRLVGLANARPGDIVIFNWDGGGTDHVGFVEKNLGNGVLQTIEGNTSSGAAGSQSAGNGVWRRRRSSSIAAIIRPRWGETSSSTTVTAANISSEKPTARRDIRALQTALRCNPDNISGPQTRSHLAALRCASNYGGVTFPYGVEFAQRVVGTPADGIWGVNSKKAHDNTVRAVQKAVGVAVDGIFGPNTDRETQEAIAAARQA